ncbi:MAG: hypothetical protein ACRDYX_17810 [Egibacteraceae bacterium]
MTPLEILLSPQGLELLDRLAGQELASDTSLRLGAELRRAYPAELVAAALAQHELRLKARTKFTRAMRMLFTRPGAGAGVLGADRPAPRPPVHRRPAYR